MASSDKYGERGMALIATLLSAALWWFGTGLAPHPWCAWLSPLPLLLMAPRLRWMPAACAALAAGACGGMNLVHYLRDVIGLPMVVNVLVIAVPAVKLALCVLLYRALALAGRIHAAALAYACLWVVLEYACALASPHGTFGSLAYSQMDALAVIQLASVTGMWGVSFVVSYVPAALAGALAPERAPRERARAGMAAVLVLIATVTFGYLRLNGSAPEETSVGLAALRGPVRPPVTSAEGAALLQRYLAAIDILAGQGAKTIVLPENAFAVGPAGIPQMAARAAQLDITIATGAAVQDAAVTERNMALAFLPAGAAPASYAKHHLIPGLESQYAAGTTYTMLPATHTGLAICKDMDFHATGRAYGERQANLLLVPAWDFGIDGWLHSRMAVMRGVESGFAIARAARRGQLTVSDNRGRVIAETTDAQGDAMLVATVPLFPATTLYTRWGDWFVWLAGGVLALVAAGACATRRLQATANMQYESEPSGSREDQKDRSSADPYSRSS